MKDHLINKSRIREWGFLEMDETKFAKINPTPIATPVKTMIGMLDDKNLKPKKSIESN